MDPTKVLFPGMEKSSSTAEEKGSQASLTEHGVSSVPKRGGEVPSIPSGGVTQPPESSNTGAKAVETPVIVTREPGEASTEKQEKTLLDGKATLGGLLERNPLRGTQHRYLGREGRQACCSATAKGEPRTRPR